MQEDFTVFKRFRLLFALTLLALASHAANAQDAEVPAGTDERPALTEPATPMTDGAAPAGSEASGADTVTPSEPAAEMDAAADEIQDEESAETEDMPAGTIVADAPERQADLPHDLSPWGMFMAADIVVKAVMIGLAFASVVTWTVLLAKLAELAAAGRAARRALHALNHARGLEDGEAALGGDYGTVGLMARAAREEMRASQAVLGHVSDDGVKERVASRLSRIEASAGRRVAKGTGILATIGSTAPFVGLFGTVWGIMNSFIGISRAQTTNLAIVAPGIAEALLATAIGLVAAIPAVVIYNFLVRAITGYRQSLADSSAAIERLVSRDLDVHRYQLASGRAGERPAVAKVG